MNFRPGMWLAQSWESLRSDVEDSPRGTSCRVWLWIGFPALLLLGATLLSRATNLDLEIQTLIYRVGGESWSLGTHPFWQGLYSFGTLPAGIVVLISVVGFLLSFYRNSFRPWRQVFLFNILLLVLSAGVIANLGLKEYWSRPRPREVEGLGGHRAFEKILAFHPEIDGKSFPCGHATMGFYFLGGFFLLRRHRRGLAEGILAFGLAFGGLIGVARMVQGGHFLSDVIWAAAICWFTGMGLYYALRLNRSLITQPGSRKKFPLWARLAAGLAGVGMLVGIGVGSPYRKTRDYFPINSYTKEGALRLHLMPVLGEFELVPANRFSIKGEAYGHGLPTSKLGVTYVEYDRKDYTHVVYKDRLSGWLAEINQQIQVNIPWERTEYLMIDSGEAEFWIELDESAIGKTIQLANGNGSIKVTSKGVPVEVVRAPTASLAISQELGEKGAAVIIHVGDQFSGNFELIEEDDSKNGSD